MNGLTMLVVWTFVAAAIALCEGWSAASKWISDNQALAAWVQAVGSIAAILAAAWFVRWQHGLELERAAAADRASRSRKFAVVVELARATASHVEFLRNQFGDRERVHLFADEGKFYDRGTIDNLGDDIGAIPMHEIDDPRIASELMVLKAHCRQMRIWIGDMLANHRNLSAEDFRRSFEFMTWTSQECTRVHANINARSVELAR